MKDFSLDPRAFLESTPLVPVAFDPRSGRISYAGPQALEYLGYPAESWLGEGFWKERVVPDDQTVLQQVRERATSMAGSYSVEYRMERADGRIVWSFETGSVTEGPDGNLLIQAFLMDVTERKRQEVTLWKQEERLRGLLRRAPDAMILTSLDGTVLNMNEQAEALVGYSLSEIVGSAVDHLVPDRLRARLPELRGAFERDSDRRTLVDGHGFAIRREDGTEVPVEWSMSLVPGTDDSGQILCSIRDLTARRRVEAQLRYSERSLREIANVLPAMVAFVDTESRYRFVNDEVGRWFGLERRQLEGRSVREVMGERLFSEMRSSIESALAGRATHFRGEIPNATGERVPVDVSLVPQHDEEGAVAGYLIVTFDVSAEVAAIEADRQHREELQHVARVSTMGELAASIAHELNQPLPAIVANAEAARHLLEREHPQTNEASEALIEIAGDAQRAGEVIASMRQLLQRGERREELVDVRALVPATVELVRSEAIGRGVSLDSRVPDNALSPVHGDEIQLQQVLLNLMLNAIDAAARITAEPRAVSVDVERGDGNVHIVVRDSGAGLPSGDPEELFDPFVSKRPEGLGMGLTICRTIVEAHGGRIWAEPNEPSGATFSVRLPLHDDHPDP